MACPRTALSWVSGVRLIGREGRGGLAIYARKHDAGFWANHSRSSGKRERDDPARRCSGMRDKRLPRGHRDIPETVSRSEAAVASSDTVRSIVVALRGAGVSFLKIGRALEAAGINAPGGGKWSTSALYHLTESEPVAADHEVAPASRTTGSQPRTRRPHLTISHAAFKARFTTHLTRALVAYGIDAPERLLFMSEAEIHNIPGVGKGALAEIELYRDCFLPRRRG